MSVRSSSDKAVYKYTLYFFPTNGAAFDLDQGNLVIQNMELPSSCNCDWDGTAHEISDVCENNGGRISCAVGGEICADYPNLVNSTCLPAGTKLDFDIKIWTDQTQWGSDQVQLCHTGAIWVQDSFTSNTGNSSKHYNTTTVF